jgi:hypothetical protein
VDDVLTLDADFLERLDVRIPAVVVSGDDRDNGGGNVA